MIESKEEGRESGRQKQTGREEARKKIEDKGNKDMLRRRPESSGDTV